MFQCIFFISTFFSLLSFPCYGCDKSYFVEPLPSYMFKRTLLIAGGTLAFKYLTQFPIPLSIGMAMILPGVWDLNKTAITNQTIESDYLPNDPHAPVAQQTHYHKKLTNNYRCAGLAWITTGSLIYTHFSDHPGLHYILFTGLTAASLMLAEAIRYYVKEDQKFDSDNIYIPLLITGGTSGLINSLHYWHNRNALIIR